MNIRRFSHAYMAFIVFYLLFYNSGSRIVVKCVESLRKGNISEVKVLWRLNVSCSERAHVTGPTRVVNNTITYEIIVYMTIEAIKTARVCLILW